MPKFDRFNMPKSREDIDRFVREFHLRPAGTVSYKGRDIFIAETDLEMDKPIEYPWGYYQVAWFVSSPTSMEKLDIGQLGRIRVHARQRTGVDDRNQTDCQNQ